MDAVEALYLLGRLGLSLEVNDGRLDVSPAELLCPDSTWLIRSHKAALMAEIQNDSPAWAWLVNHGTHSVETYHHPERTRHQVLLAYPGAVSVERLPESMYPHGAAGKHD
jgi:hypothetical protein